MTIDEIVTLIQADVYKRQEPGGKIGAGLQGCTGRLRCRPDLGSSASGVVARP